MTEKPRLIMVVSTFPQFSETFIVNKFLDLITRGWDVYIVCQQIDKAAWAGFPQLEKTKGIKQRVHSTWPHQPRWLAGLLFLPGLLLSLTTSPQATWHYLRRGWARFRWSLFKHFYLDLPLIRLNPDILHFEFGSLAVGRTYLKNLLNTKFSVSFRGYDLNFVALDDPNHYQRLWQTLDACHLLSKHLWQRAMARGCPADLPHTLIPPALNLAAFPEDHNKDSSFLGAATRPIRILSIGRLEWKKGYEHGLLAVKQLSERGYHCIYRIIGSGDYQAALNFACHQLNLNDTVEFLGGLAHAEVVKQLVWADVCLHPSLSEGFCNAVLEAQASGLPIVCSDAGGLSENIADGLTGFIVPRRDPAAIAEKLIQLAQDGQIRLRMGQAGRHRVEQCFQLDKQLDAFEEFYGSL